MSNLQTKFEPISQYEWCVRFIYDDFIEANGVNNELNDYKTRIVYNNGVITIDVFEADKGNIIASAFVANSVQLGLLNKLTHICTGYLHDDVLTYNNDVPIRLETLQIID